MFTQRSLILSVNGDDVCRETTTQVLVRPVCVCGWIGQC